MKQMMPQEIQVWYVLPALRKEFARCFVDNGLTQKQAAGHLGVTEAAVSQYFCDKRGREVKLPQEVLLEIERSAVSVIQGKANLREELYRISLLEGTKKAMCRTHKEQEEVQEGCDICFRYEEW